MTDAEMDELRNKLVEMALGAADGDASEAVPALITASFAIMLLTLGPQLASGALREMVDVIVTRASN